jgi:hypothetical protein
MWLPIVSLNSHVATIYSEFQSDTNPIYPNQQSSLASKPDGLARIEPEQQSNDRARERGREMFLNDLTSNDSHCSTCAGSMFGIV